MSSVIERLTEGIVNRDMKQEGNALLSKWERTGLLEGLDAERNRHTMARLLENQAKELLRESTTMAGGDVEGFAAVAFPIVRRVFAGLIANDLVSVQPMSLPSGLIFFLDFTVSAEVGDGSSLAAAGGGATGRGRMGYEVDDSIYGGGRVGAQITGGIDLTTDTLEDGPYSLNNAYASATGSQTISPAIVASGTYGDTTDIGNGQTLTSLCKYDADFTSGTTKVAVFSADLTSNPNILSQTNLQDEGGNLVALVLSGGMGHGLGSGSASDRQIRRLTAWSGSHGGTATKSRTTVIFVAASEDGSRTAVQLSESFGGAHGNWQGALLYPRADGLTTSNALGSVIGTSAWALENEKNIPEIDIKVDSVAVTAMTKKLKAKWTPELGQDLNAYHNLDAEVELTQILSEQIALEIDREILADLVNGANAAVYYWSRSPGLFVKRDTGAEIGASSAAPDFTGTVSEWYETLVETINDVSAQIHRKTLRGGANFIVCGPEVAGILEFTSGFRASVTVDSDTGTIGTVKSGNLSKKWDVYVDPYFMRNVVLVGRRGSSFLESGYVYAPYVPLQTTPTIFGPEDFVPRKGVMTRYAKKMVRPDMYGLVIVRGLIGEAGATS